MTEGMGTFVPERRGDWMQTFTGRQFWPLDARAEEVDILDIAHALSMQCRYAGHVRRFYSVAEHCCHLHDVAPEGEKLAALLHDATEAYLVDLPRPVKRFLPEYGRHEYALARVIAQRFGLPMLETPAVREIDRRILMDERQQAMEPPPAPWSTNGEPLGVTLRFWPPEKARTCFLARAALLGIADTTWVELA